MYSLNTCTYMYVYIIFKTYFYRDFFVKHHYSRFVRYGPFNTTKRSRHSFKEYIVLNSEAASTDAGFARSVTNLVCDSFDFNDQFRGFTNGDGDYLSKSLRPLSELLGAL